MRQYIDTAQDISGNALPFATCKVLNFPSGSNASIFSDNGLTPIGTSQVSADVTGQFNFFAADGDYTLQLSNNAVLYKTQSPVSLFDGAAQVTFPDVGAVNAYATTNSALEKALRAGLRAFFQAGVTNTGASTFTYNTLAPKPIIFAGGSALTAGSIVATGIYGLEYDGASWQLRLATPVVPGTPQSAVEAGVGAVVVNPQFPYYPYVDPRRYGADPTGATDATAGMQAALNVAYALNGAIWLGNASNYLVGAMSLTLTGANSTGLRIFGSGATGSKLTAKIGTNAPILTFTSANPATGLIQCTLILENFLIFQPNAKVAGGHGVSIQGIADWQLHAVQCAGFDHGLDLISSLVGIVSDDCQFSNNNIGVSIALSGSVNTTNLIKIENSRLVGNSSWGLEFNGGAQLLMYNNDIEQNGTTTVFTTGGVHIKGQLAPDSQVAGVLLRSNWFEQNLGTSLLVDASTNGANLNLALEGGHIISAQSGASFTCNGCQRLMIKDLAYSDTCNLTAQNVIIENSLITTLTDTNVAVPVYFNIQTAAGFILNGQVKTAPIGITGCTTAPTVSATFVLQGDQVIMYIPDQTAVSNSTSCTLTGIPAKYQPASTKFFSCVVENNSADGASIAAIVGASGTMLLYQGGSQTGFTAGGNKGVRAQEFRWRISA